MSERYEIRGRISQGGVGAVYRAWDTRLEREVAVKRLLPPEDEAQAESAAQSLKREANALSALQHPNIIMIYGIEHDDEGPYLVLELIDGVNLEQFVEQSAKGGSLPQDQFLSIAEQVLDFGLAKFSAQPSLQTIDQSGSILGSIYFMAPEQFERLPLDTRTDMYSVGCVFYYLLAGSYPFDGDTMAAVMESHLYHRVTPLWERRPDIDPSLAAWVMKFLERSSDDRYPNADVALSALGNWRSGGGGSRPAGGSEQPRITARQPILSGSGSQHIQPGNLSGRRPATGQVGRASQLLSISGQRPETDSQAVPAGVVRPATGAIRTASGRVRTTSGRVAPAETESPPDQPLDRSTILKLVTIGATAIGLIALLILIWFLFRAMNPPTNASLERLPATALAAIWSAHDSPCIRRLAPPNEPA